MIYIMNNRLIRLSKQEHETLWLESRAKYLCPLTDEQFNRMVEEEKQMPHQIWDYKKLFSEVEQDANQILLRLEVLDCVLHNDTFHSFGKYPLFRFFALATRGIVRKKKSSSSSRTLLDLDYCANHESVKCEQCNRCKCGCGRTMAGHRISQTYWKGK